jgi:hypothetical protein
MLGFVLVLDRTIGAVGVRVVWPAHTLFVHLLAQLLGAGLIDVIYLAKV